MALKNNKELVIIIKKEDIKNLFELVDFNTNQQEYKTNTTLTQRELEVLQLITQGKNNYEIADSLKMSIHTIKADVCSILHKLHVSDRLKAAVKAVKENLI